MENIKQFLILIFVFFLPFGQALTINIGFPLKISELALILFLLLSINFSKVTFYKWQLKYILLLCTILFFSFVSFVVNYFWEFDYSLALSNVRFVYPFDSILKIVYLFISFCGFFSIILNLNNHRVNNYINYIFAGAIVSLLYAWYLFFSNYLHLPEYLLPGMDLEPQRVSNGPIRCGTFKEGNYFGLFILIMVILSAYYKRFKSMFFFTISIITSFSTVGMISVFLFSSFYFIRSLYIRKKYYLILSSFVIIFSSIIFLLNTNNILRTMLVSKLVGNTEFENSNAESTYSKQERTESSITAFKLGLDNLVFGVGPSNYSLHYDQYYSRYKFKNKYFKPKKPVCNNVYMELFSEQGIVGLILFLFFLYLIISQAFRLEWCSFGVGNIFVLIYLFAFPSYSILFLWVYFAIIVSAFHINNNKQWMKIQR
ncbi:MAG: Geobacillus virus [Bacteroidota bacterium]|jgi:hypothetical protein